MALLSPQVVTIDTIAKCDEALMQCVEAHHKAFDDGDLKACDRTEARLNELLDLRFKLPQQKRTA